MSRSRFALLSKRKVNDPACIFDWFHGQRQNPLGQNSGRTARRPFSRPRCFYRGKRGGYDSRNFCRVGRKRIPRPGTGKSLATRRFTACRHRDRRRHTVFFQQHALDAKTRHDGTTIYLKTSPEILFERLKNERSQRPLLKNLSESELKSFIQKRLEEREPFYQRADFVWNQTSDAAIYLEKILMLIEHS